LSTMPAEPVEVDTFADRPALRVVDPGEPDPLDAWIAALVAAAPAFSPEVREDLIRVIG
jgi:hypothetical protein